MKYHVICKITGELKTLTHTEVNDMDYDINGNLVVYGLKNEAYYLIVDQELFED